MCVCRYKRLAHLVGEYIRENSHLSRTFLSALSNTHRLTIAGTHKHTQTTQQQQHSSSVTGFPSVVSTDALRFHRGTSMELQMLSEGRGRKVFFFFCQGLFLHDVSLKLAQSSLKHFCFLRADHRDSCLFFDLPRNKLLPCSEQLEEISTYHDIKLGLTLFMHTAVIRKVIKTEFMQSFHPCISSLSTYVCTQNFKCILI